jgi:hypothetical protein
VCNFIEKASEDDKTDKRKYQHADKEKGYVFVCEYVVFVSKIQETEYRKEEKEAENDVQLI